MPLGSAWWWDEQGRFGLSSAGGVSDTWGVWAEEGTEQASPKPSPRKVLTLELGRFGGFGRGVVALPLKPGCPGLGPSAAWGRWEAQRQPP